MRRAFRRFVGHASGATAIEYSLIAAFMAICLLAALPGLSEGVGTQYNHLGTELSKTSR